MSTCPYMDIHIAITQGTFIAYLHRTNQYTLARQEAYDTWKELHATYLQHEFEVLVQRPDHSGTSKQKVGVRNCEDRQPGI
jgi:hypothetical protein